MSLDTSGPGQTSSVLGGTTPDAAADEAPAASQMSGNDQDLNAEAAVGNGEGDAMDGEDGNGVEVPSASITLRALIVSSDASIIIGKQGKHINEIREQSGARLAIVSLSVSLQ